MKKNMVWLLLSLVTVFSFIIFTSPAMTANAPQAPPAGTLSADATTGSKVNINSADVETLCTLKGIGPALALRIKEFREQHGPFKTPEDVTQVRGVGNTILEWNKNMIDVK